MRAGISFIQLLFSIDTFLPDAKKVVFEHTVFPRRQQGQGVELISNLMFNTTSLPYSICSHEQSLITLHYH